MNQKNSPVYQTLLVAASMAEDNDNALFLHDLTMAIPFRWEERHPRDGDLTERFPGLPSE